jgi:DNA-binding XRE family transcriptional regulator
MGTMIGYAELAELVKVSRQTVHRAGERATRTVA